MSEDNLTFEKLLLIREEVLRNSYVFLDVLDRVRADLPLLLEGVRDLNLEDCTDLPLISSDESIYMRAVFRDADDPREDSPNILSLNLTPKGIIGKLNNVMLVITKMDEIEENDYDFS